LSGTPVERIEFIRSRKKNLALLLLSVALVSAAAYMVRTGEDQFDRTVGWFGVAFFGYGIVLALKNIVRGGVVFIFDRNGVTDQSRGIVIPWSEIEECVVISVRGTKFLGLSLKHPDQFLNRVSSSQQKLSKFNQRMGWGHWALSFAGVSPGVQEALSFIQTHGRTV
jgi:hypothetical protein